jgi:hypothetical protein
MLHEYHVIYSVRYYPRFHVTAVRLGTYYPWIRRHYCNTFISVCVDTLSRLDKVKIVLFSHEGGWRRGSAAPLIPHQYNEEDALLPEKSPRRSVEAVWAFWRREKSLATAQNGPPDSPFRSLVTVLTELSR